MFPLSIPQVSSTAPEPKITPKMIKIKPQICAKAIFSFRKITAATNDCEKIKGVK
jgi:hypothetical protein